MSTQALRRAVDQHQRSWTTTLARLSRRYARDLSGVKSPGDVALALGRLILREGPAAQEVGGGGIVAAVKAAGLAPRAIVTPPAPAPPVALEQMVRRSWMAAAIHPDTVGARAAAVDRIVSNALTLAWRGGSAEQIRAEPEVTGYRRVANDGACGACLALQDGAIMADDDPFEAHPGCLCTAEPVVSGLNDRSFGRPTGQERFDALSAREQDLMFAGHGGAAKADLLRAGTVRMEDLIVRHPRRPGQTPLLSERPLHALT